MRVMGGQWVGFTRWEGRSRGGTESNARSDRLSGNSNQNRQTKPPRLVRGATYLYHIPIGLGRTSDAVRFVGQL